MNLCTVKWAKCDKYQLKQCLGEKYKGCATEKHEEWNRRQQTAAKHSREVQQLKKLQK